MRAGLVGGGENTGGFDDVFRAGILPWDFIRVHASVNGGFFAIDDELSILDGDVAFKLSMHGVITEHVNHVIQVDEWIVDCNDCDVGIGCGCAEDQAADTAKAIDAYFNCHIYVLLY
ncbi:hypothetical protein SDC9_157704 [bioreactor metagenome]|uniref:Uncharacterized protein n=1 Tax=bioreactor metagenome TaxID=1076179 RepID=A0A645FAP8_9ZZZZ